MKLILGIILLIYMQPTISQEIPVEELGDQLESMTENIEEEIEDDSWMEQLRYLKKHPLNLNTATEDELAQLSILTPLQIRNLLRYRSILGNLIHLNELQAVPGWDPAIIRKLVPFITVSNDQFSTKKFKERLKNGEKFLLLRTSNSLENVSEYVGTSQQIVLKFQYNYGKLLQCGFLAEKDAGERLIYRNGFDFNSFHFFAREI